jgi:hypothetical protein
LGGLTFEEADLTTWWPDERFDLIFVNSVLQWLPCLLATEAPGILRSEFPPPPADGFVEHDDAALEQHLLD